MSIARTAATVAALALLTAPMATVPTLAAGAEPISVKVNMARILRINSPAATVIIGNPGVADVTIQDPQTLVLTGRSYGQTNLIILDSIGNPIADTLVDVIQEQGDLVTVYMGNAKTTVACSPVCQPTIMLGDDAAFTSAVVASSSIVADAAR